MQGAQVQSLVRELKSHKLCGVDKKKKRKEKIIECYYLSGTVDKHQLSPHRRLLL